MHKSQLGGLIIDCQTENLDQAATFWSSALGLKAISDPRSDNSKYRRLETRSGDPEIEVQKVDHESRVIWISKPMMSLQRSSASKASAPGALQTSTAGL